MTSAILEAQRLYQAALEERRNDPIDPVVDRLYKQAKRNLEILTLNHTFYGSPDPKP